MNVVFARASVARRLCMQRRWRNICVAAGALVVIGGTVAVSMIGSVEPLTARPRRAEVIPSAANVMNSDVSLYSGGVMGQGQQFNFTGSEGVATTRHAQRSARRAARFSRSALNAQASAGDVTGSFGAGPSFGGSSVVATARRYIGTNPTGRSSLWCGAFMDMVLKKTGHAGGGNLAAGYAKYGTRVSGPQVGAIAVIGRGRGTGPSGHVGIVSGIDAEGNPIVISGNHNRTVAESVYPKSRVRAYVMPSS